MKYLLIVAGALGAGCDSKDNTFTDLDGNDEDGDGIADDIDMDDDGDGINEDTGLAPGDGLMHSECYEQIAAVPFDLDGDGAFETCTTHNIGVNSISHVGAKVRDMNVYGYGTSQGPELDNPVRLWALIVPPPTSGAIWQIYPGDQLYTDDSFAGGAGDYWFSWWSDMSGQLGNINDDTPYVDFYTFGAEISESEAEYTDYCLNYDDSDKAAYMDEGRVDDGMVVCVASEWYSGDATPWDDDTSCVAGTGTFGMVPIIYQDADNDGSASATWMPIREDSGRGTFTADAIVKSIRVVEDNGIPFRVVYDGQTYSFDETDDALSIAARASVRLSETKATTFAVTGKRIVTGASHIISEAYPVDEALDSELSITWTCPLAATRTSRTAPTVLQGYTAKLGDLGCELYQNQKITVRPIFGTNSYARVSLAGQEQHAVIVPLKFNERYYFDVNLRGFDVEGSIGDTNARDGMQVDFTKISFVGTNQCTTGSYTFPKEG